MNIGPNLTTIMKGDDETVSAIPVASTAVVYTKHFPLVDSLYFGLLASATCDAGTVDVKVELEQGNTVPNAAASDTSWAVPETAPVSLTLDSNDTTRIDTVSPVVGKFARFKLTGQGANPATTTVSLTIAHMEG